MAPYKRIATEEAWTTREVLDAQYALAVTSEAAAEPWAPYIRAFMEKPARRAAAEELMDIGAGRLARMDELGIDMQILSLTAPGVQVLDPQLGAELAAHSNDVLAAACAAHPDRFAGLLAIAPHNVAASVAEVHRGVTELGLKGVIVNSHTQGRYLDEPEFEPLLKAIADAGVPLYIHPTPPPVGWGDVYVYRGIANPLGSFSHDLWIHTLGLILGGVFDRIPHLKLVIGHAGEAMPLLLYRLDWMQKHAENRPGLRGGQPPIQLQHKVSHYFRHNIWVTTSGVAWEPAIKFCMEVLGDDRVLYAMDYPYQVSAEEVRTYDELDIPAESKRMLMQTNAEQLFGLVN